MNENLSNEKRIVSVIALLAIAIALFFAYDTYISEKGKAWNVFQDYLTASREHDLERMKTLAHHLSSVCEDSPESDDCKTRMDTVALIGGEFNKSNFKNVWSDEKQLVLVTNWDEQDTEDTIIRMRQIIYFLKSEGEIKLVAFKPWQGTFMVKDKENPRPVEELQSMIKTYTDDLDFDGMDDYLEECLSDSQEETCIKTDPKLRDSDGDGFWDGVQAQFEAK
ncbi:MAG TPA: hypothetical protein VJH67_01235 [Candidatus Paceibacterota bacterium]